VHKETKKPNTQAFSMKKFVQLFFNHACAIKIYGIFDCLTADQNDQPFSLFNEGRRCISAKPPSISSLKI